MRTGSSRSTQSALACSCRERSCAITLALSTYTVSLICFSFSYAVSRQAHAGPPDALAVQRDRRPRSVTPERAVALRRWTTSCGPTASTSARQQHRAATARRTPADQPHRTSSDARHSRTARAADQWPVGGTFEMWPACWIRFSLFAACFSFNVLPCFFAWAFRGDLSDMFNPSLAAAEAATPAADRR